MLFLIKKEGFIRKYDRAKYLQSFHFDKKDKKIDRIRYLTMLENNVSDVSHTYMKLKLIQMMTYI